MSSRPTIYVVENHHEILQLWRDLRFNNIKLLHLDAHCDMHGALVDRKKNFIYILPDLKTLDCGNFLSFAAKEEIIKELDWIHDKYGGRDKDITYVKYESDLTATPYLIRNFFFPLPKYPFKYTELLFSDKYFEVEENEHLDIDWDYFSLMTKSYEERQKSINLFLSWNFVRIPRYTYLSYSPDYVSDSREEFNDFILKLQDKFNADVIKYSYSFKKYEKVPNILTKYKETLSWRIRKYLFFPFKKILNKIGIY